MDGRAVFAGRDRYRWVRFPAVVNLRRSQREIVSHVEVASADGLPARRAMSIGILK
jgi:hypothetical protein